MFGSNHQCRKTDSHGFVAEDTDGSESYSVQKFTKEEKTLRQLQDWGKKHIRMRTKVNYNFALTADEALNGNRNDEYRRYFITKEYEYISDTSRHFPLGEYGETVKEWMHSVSHLIEVFHERHDMRAQLDKLLRDDPLYDRMEEIFYTFAARILHLFCFFQYDRISNDQYRETMQKQIGKLIQRADLLLDYYGSYLSFQVSSAYTDDTDEIDHIQIAVEAMQEALEQSKGTMLS